IDLGTFSMEKIPAVDRLPLPSTGGISRLGHLTVHPDGSRIASLINDSRIRVWDTQDFSRLQTLYGYGWAHSVADALYLPKVNRIVTGKYTDVLHFWDATTGELLKAVEFYAYIHGLSASPDGAKIAMAVENTSQIWDATTVERLAILDLDCLTAGNGATAFSPSGEHFVYMGMCGSHFWNAETGEKIAWKAENALEKEHMDRCWTNFSLAVFSSDGKQFVAIPENFDEQPKTMVWDFETGLPLSETKHIGPVVDVGIGFLQAYQVNDTVEVRFLKSNKLFSRISDDLPEWSHWEIFSNVRFHPSGNVLAIRHHWHSVVPGEFRFYNVWSGKMISTVSGIMDLQFAADGSYMFLVDDEAQLGLYRTSEVIGKPIPSVFTVHAFEKITTFGQIKRDQLLQNYPNPFNPETWIPYHLAEASNVIIHIHDVIGRLVRTLDLGYKQAGDYVSKDVAAYWDGRNNLGEEIASGVYYCSIHAGNFSAGKKLILLK
ncbi:FlgD immunoglobulin-like domain containing protein, partial [Candidatus Poribacteria bacterium]